MELFKTEMTEETAMIEIRSVSKRRGYIEIFKSSKVTVPGSLGANKILSLVHITSAYNQNIYKSRCFQLRWKEYCDYDDGMHTEELEDDESEEMRIGMRGGGL